LLKIHVVEAAAKSCLINATAAFLGGGGAGGHNKVSHDNHSNAVYYMYVENTFSAPFPVLKNLYNKANVYIVLHTDEH
jgi:hypothetical protein